MASVLAMQFVKDAWSDFSEENLKGTISDSNNIFL